MADVLSYHDSFIDNIDVKADSISDWEKEINIKRKAKEYVEMRIKEWISREDLVQLLADIRTLLQRQDIEKISLHERLKQRVISETKELLSIENFIQETKILLYEKLWINVDLGKNSDIQKFIKWFVDGLILKNIEIVKEIVEWWIDSFVNTLKELLTVTWIMEIIRSLKDEIKDLWNILQKPYE